MTTRTPARMIVLATLLASSLPLAGLGRGVEQQPCNPAEAPCIPLTLKIVFTSTRHAPTAQPIAVAEIYLMNPDGSNARRLTYEPSNGMPAMAPSGRGKVVFDSNRLRTAAEPVNTSDLFLMNADGSEQTFLTRGSSADWSPDSEDIVFHRSLSGTGLPVKSDPGAPTTDSVIFMANVKDLLENGSAPTQITTPEEGQIDDDASWSPDGKKIVFTRKDRDDPNPMMPGSAEIYVLNLETGKTEQLTDNLVEERSASWHPDSQHIVYSCRIGTRGGNALETCVMNVETRAETLLTDNAVADLGPHFSLDGLTILFQKPGAGGPQQIWMMDEWHEHDPSDIFPAESITSKTWGLLCGRNPPLDWRHCRSSLSSCSRTTPRCLCSVGRRRVAGAGREAPRTPRSSNFRLSAAMWRFMASTKRVM